MREHGRHSVSAERLLTLLKRQYFSGHALLSSSCPAPRPVGPILYSIRAALRAAAGHPHFFNGTKQKHVDARIRGHDEKKPGDLLHRLFAINHPRDAELVVDHAEAPGPERLHDRHAHFSTVTQRSMDALGIFRLVDTDRDR